MEIGARTDTGLVRKDNQDSYCVCRLKPDGDVHLLAVADGMGGHEAGDLASAIAIETLKEKFVSLDGSSTASADGDWLLDLDRAFAAANDRIFSASLQLGHPLGMGTTLTAVIVAGGRAFVGHIGDSRAYLLRQGTLRQLTEDHSLVGEMVRNGGLTEAEATQHPQRNILTRALGSAEQVAADFFDLELQPGDGLLLCTDGLFNLIDRDELSLHLAGAESPQRAADALVSLACERGAPDNVTAVVARLGASREVASS